MRFACQTPVLTDRAYLWSASVYVEVGLGVA